jgi:hypothetical protein
MRDFRGHQKRSALVKNMMIVASRPGSPRPEWTTPQGLTRVRGARPDQGRAGFLSMACADCLGQLVVRVAVPNRDATLNQIACVIVATAILARGRDRPISPTQIKRCE